MSPLSSQPSHSLLLAPASQAGSQRSSWEHSTICHTAARCPRKSGSGGIYLSGPPSSQRVPAALAVLGPHSILQVPTVPRANIRHVGGEDAGPRLAPLFWAVARQPVSLLWCAFERTWAFCRDFSRRRVLAFSFLLSAFMETCTLPVIGVGVGFLLLCGLPLPATWLLRMWG